MDPLASGAVDAFACPCCDRLYQVLLSLSSKFFSFVLVLLLEELYLSSSSVSRKIFPDTKKN
nr:MAG TPA: zinc-ribbon family protein [Caudoviricetes sp.]